MDAAGRERTRADLDRHPAGRAAGCSHDHDQPPNQRISGVRPGTRDDVGPRPPGDERIVLPAAAEALGRARRWVALVAASLDEDRRTDATLIVSELLAVGLRRADPTVEWVT